ncbi:unnamed protein product [Closterium sp. NIES-53]
MTSLGWEGASGWVQTAGKGIRWFATGDVGEVDSKGIRWFATGDVGEVHPDGVFQIIDRKKDIVKLQAGEYVSLGKVRGQGSGGRQGGDTREVHPHVVFQIIDRKKDIVKLQAGEYVSLGKVEAVLQVSSFVENVMLYADPFKTFTIALVVPSKPALAAWAKAQGVDSSDYAALCANPEAVSQVLKSLAEVIWLAEGQRFC